MDATSRPGAVGPSETLYQTGQVANASDTGSWWYTYLSQLSGMSTTAKSVLAHDCKYILELGILGRTEEAAGGASARRGLVMGSVQSGKTASMFGVTALALDDGFDLIILLAGTRLSLWSQTHARFQAQVDVGVDGSSKESRRLLLPRRGEGLRGLDVRAPLSVLYRFEPPQVRRAVREHTPMIVLAMKHPDHLRALAKAIREVVFPVVLGAGRTFKMLVLDDEADDGSILDAAAEDGVDPIYGRMKQIPRAIAELWDPRLGGAAPSNLQANYVAYTATPQANLLQQNHNPLAPEDFVISLRTAYDRGGLTPRSSTYLEPGGLDMYYTGGEIFYRRAARAALCVATSGQPEVDLANAVRSFLVACAVRTARSAHLIGPDSARRATFSSNHEAAAACAAPMAMLIHPSAQVRDQFVTALHLLAWTGHPDPARAREELSQANAYLSDQLCETLESDSDLWQSVLRSYRESAEQLRLIFDNPVEAFVPEWDEVKAILRNEIIPGTRVSVVNSDPDADDRPDYAPWQDSEGWHAPRDLVTIFVSGNVMSRGLTLEGLTTTLFLRSTTQPFADTQMQMQRWFGYRGAYIELCRVFASRHQLDLFAAYHDGDEALRQEVIEAMNKVGDRAPTPLVLQGEGYLATGKISNIRQQPLCPGPKPFIRLVNDGNATDPNSELLAATFKGEPSQELIAGGRLRGQILNRPFTLDAAAEILDQLRFDNYAPSEESWHADMWRQVQLRVEAQGHLPDGFSLYRVAKSSSTTSVTDPRPDCPHSLAAYLRLWSACLSRHVRGLFPTETPLRRWPMLDLDERRRLQPRFWVGVRYGGGAPVSRGPLAELPFALPVMDRSVAEGELVATWGSRDPDAGADGYRGDEYFDYYFRSEEPPRFVAGAPPWRPLGSDGQILFHVNQPEGQAFPTVTVGVCVPLGGPDQFAATIASHTEERLE